MEITGLESGYNTGPFIRAIVEYLVRRLPGEGLEVQLESVEIGTGPVENLTARFRRLHSAHGVRFSFPFVSSVPPEDNIERFRVFVRERRDKSEDEPEVIRRRTGATV